jgi:hypothetical protein
MFPVQECYALLSVSTPRILEVSPLFLLLPSLITGGGGR